MNRRNLITGLISFVAAPAIVRAGSLMPVKSFVLPDLRHSLIDFRYSQNNRCTILYMADGSMRIINDYRPDQLEVNRIDI